MNIIFDKEVIARKQYDCCAYGLITESLRCKDPIFEDEDLVVIKKFRDNGGKIKKGERHRVVKFVDLGTVVTSRFNFEMEAIADSYYLYEE